MILAHLASRDHDLSTLRVVFTGGEPLPYSQAARFEELTHQVWDGDLIVRERFFYDSRQFG